MVEDIFVVPSFPRWRRRERSIVLTIQDNEAVASSTSLEESWFPRRTITRAFEGEAHLELMEHVQNTEQVAALVDASDYGAVAIGIDGPEMNILGI